MLTLKLSRAINRGRAEPAPPPDRASLLVTLLRKRAAAHNVGADELESMLRDQIRWALPIAPTEEASPDQGIARPGAVETPFGQPAAK